MYEYKKQEWKLDHINEKEKDNCHLTRRPKRPIKTGATFRNCNITVEERREIRNKIIGGGRWQKETKKNQLVVVVRIKEGKFGS